nr:MAG TPA: hypothetical protein [Bacteriophage sp.]
MQSEMAESLSTKRRTQRQQSSCYGWCLHRIRPGIR